MANQAASRAFAGGLDNAHRNSRGARGDNGVGRSCVVDLSEQLDLEIGTLRRIFLDEVGLRQSFLHVCGELETLNGRIRRQPDDREVLPGCVDIATQIGFGIRARVGGHHVEAARQVLRSPTRADDSSADDCDSLYWFRRCLGLHVLSFPAAHGANALLDACLPSNTRIMPNGSPSKGTPTGVGFCDTAVPDRLLL